MSTKTQWWYDDATYHYSSESELVLARLTIRNNGTAELLVGGQEVLECQNEEAATSWLVSEEYEPLSSLFEDLAEKGVPVDPRIKLPTATSQEEFNRQMVILLEPANKLVSETELNTWPSPSERGSSSSRSAPN